MTAVLSEIRIEEIANKMGLEPDDVRILVAVARAESHGEPACLDGDLIRISRKTRRLLKRLAPEIFTQSHRKCSRRLQG
ncbi:hypothetical protein [Sansalvadorimonas verongulae]|uniref:hypothetical protein n=1 Tax=Sansalvadorimonas verongulae TaxID=2172824 RepID=UPI0012BBB748|nr:hypothetical protein [Sansalvadorimonas verongulae]MTI12562.1 hypothetical protein [Sansalvadorimonas verongulae]